EDIIFKSSTMGILRTGTIYPFDGVRDLMRFKAMGLSGRFRFGLSSAALAYRKRYTRCEEIPALDWFAKYAGKQATEAIWKPMLEVKFGDAANRIPLAWIAGRLRQRVLSRQQGIEKLGYLHGSLQRLTDRLVEELRIAGVKLELGRKVKQVQQPLNQSPFLLTDDGRRITANRIVLTIPTTFLAPVFEPACPDYARQLRSIEYLGACCTVLSLKRKLSDIYWTNIADGNCDFGGVIEQTNLVAPEHYGGRNLVYLSKYASKSDPIWHTTDQQLVENQLSQLEEVYQQPVRNNVVDSWVFRTRHAAPLPDMGFRDRVPVFQTPLKDVYMASMCHLHPEERSVNNSIRVAAELARQMGENRAADSVPRGISDAGQIGRMPASTVVSNAA
ncbi:MAG: FAD-dependent oxidoreductase, partial [Planctomycetota bacterium]|nr:FAD-dependent oxidoreductase [Planctomycetota bacterium]